RNLHILERAPGFTRGNAALALYQAGKIKPIEMDGEMVSPARKWLEDAIKADPSLIHDENFHRRRRNIERKFDVDIAYDMIDFIDKQALVQKTRLSPPVKITPEKPAPEKSVPDNPAAAIPAPKRQETPTKETPAQAIPAKETEEPETQTQDEQTIEIPLRDPRLATDSDELIAADIERLSSEEVTTNGQTFAMISNDMIVENIKPIRAGLEELIRRADVPDVYGNLMPYDHSDMARQIVRAQAILRTGKDPETGGTVELTDRQRYSLHVEIMTSLKLAQDQVDLRLALAEKLVIAGQYVDASKYFREAVEKSDLIKEHFMADGNDLIKAQQEISATDAAAINNTPIFADPASGSSEPKYGMADALNARGALLSGNLEGSSDMRETPVLARLYAAQHSLGYVTYKTDATDPNVTYQVFDENGVRVKNVSIWAVEFGKRPGWDGAQAGQYLNEVVELTKEIKGVNPILPENSAKSDLFLKTARVFEVAQSLDDATLRKSLQKTDGFNQGLSFAAGMTAAALVLVSTRFKGTGATTVVGGLTRSALRAGTAVALAGGAHALTYRGLTGEWESATDIAFHGAASTLAAGVMFKLVAGENGNLNLISRDWTEGVMNRALQKVPSIGRLAKRTTSTFADATGKLTAGDGARIAEARGFETAESLAAGFRRIGWDDLAVKFETGLTGLKPGTRASSAEVVAIIEKNNLNREILEMVSLIGKNGKFDTAAVLTHFEKSGVETIDDFVNMVEKPLASLRAGNEIIAKAGLSDTTLLTDAAKSVAGLDDAFLVAAKSSKITRVGQLKTFLAEGGSYETLTVAKQWPVIAGLRAEVAGNTPLREVVKRGVHVFDSALDAKALGKELLLKNTRGKVFSESVEGLSARSSVGQWGSDLFRGAKNQFQVSPVQMSPTATVADIARVPKQLQIVERNRNYLRGLVGLGLYRNTSRTYELMQGGMSFPEALKVANFPEQAELSNLEGPVGKAFASGFGIFMSTPVAPIMSIRMFSGAGRVVPVWRSPLAAEKGKIGKVFQTTPYSPTFWRNMSAIRPESNMYGQAMRQFVGVRNAILPNVGLAAPMAYDVLINDWSGRSLNESRRQTLQYTRMNESNLPFNENATPTLTLREYMQSQIDRNRPAR
ncbi:MAG: hypothetical protein K8F91_16435, partial [Candidatus Obscuribacterales bacterium]|nr:hypothetical protein [Candidatus Obscuribacterales bacterium]